ncbi:tetratricopeptide repeat-containing sensor histidine kinase [Olleya sp. HaHaR_3_96]|uniref:tetratricopeptide repeat-containing sensor histidine kinase n=1 Tax=Olleya sp. HaHaR_3_96 TaxID=2745560 RepID=UPI001C4FEDCE|nr:tetratricopeptide repeat-containing sensor histidine kinase [Olleya sp. HaHaR_3_96]QXP59482.1 tetratricopeptide repeat protein [Olleya sp. HaHaR_3_96]
MLFKSQHIFVFFFTCYTCLGIAQNSAPVTESEDKKVEQLVNYFNNGLEKKAYQQAHALLPTFKSDKSVASINLLLAYYHNKYVAIDSSIYYTNKALKSRKNVNDSLGVRLQILSYQLLALNNKNKGLYQESKNYYIKGAELSEKFNETNLYYTHIHGLASTYLTLGKTEEALELFEKCVKFSNDEDVILGSYINLGSIYSLLSKYERSNSYLQKAKEMCEKNPHRTQALISVLLNIGDNYLNKETDKALLSYNEAKKISFEHRFYNLELIALGKIGNILFNEKKDNEAFLVFSNILIQAMELGNLDVEKNSYLMLEKLSVRKQDYRNAYNYGKKYYEIKDSIDNSITEKEINRLEVRFKTLEKEKTIKLLQIESLNKSLNIKNKDADIEKYKLQKTIIAKQNENQVLQLQNGVKKRKNEISLLKEKEARKAIELDREKTIKYVVLIAFFILLVPIAGLLIIYYQKLQAQSLLNLKEKEINEQQVVSLKKDQELKLIKASVRGQDLERKKIAQEMHDSIGGNLAAIKLQFSQLSKHPSKLNLIYSQLDDTYEQVRSLSHNLLPKKIRENDFGFLIKEYIATVEDASDLKINISFYDEEKINRISKILQNELFSVFQELTTNTLKYAKAKTVDIQLDLLNEGLFFVYEDDGIGFDLSLTTLGIGLTNIKNRVENYKGILHIDSKLGRGTSINIEMPVTT